jgi:hypothetical protein
MSADDDDFELLDLGRLTPKERQLWDKFCGPQVGPSEGPGFQVWSFGYICMFELGHVPEVVSAYLHEHDPNNLILQYWENMRRAIRERRKADS